MAIAAALVLMLVGALGAVLAAVGLPGMWFMLGAALVIDAWWQPDLLTWWPIAIVGALAVLGEVAEIVAGAVGAKRAGGSRRAAIGALLGGLAGALLGTVLIPIPIVGTILGSAIGAGVGALSMELSLKEDRDGNPRTKGQAMRVGHSAFTARLLASLLKGVLGVVAWGVLGAAVLIEGF